MKAKHYALQIHKAECRIDEKIEVIRIEKQVSEDHS